MHPYKVWVKSLVNAVARDVIFSKHGEDTGPEQVRLVVNELFNIIAITIENEDLKQELLKIYVQLEYELDIGGLDEKSSGFAIASSRRITELLGNVFLTEEQVATVFVSGGDIVKNSREYLPSTYDCFKAGELRDLFAASTSISAAQEGTEDDEGVIVSSQMPSHKVREDEKEQRSHIPWRIYLAMFVLIVLIGLWLVSRFNITVITRLDILVFAALAPLIAFVFFNPRTRFMRLFRLLITIFAGYTSLSVAAKFGYSNENIDAVIGVISGNDTVLSIGFIVLMAICLILDYLLRK